VRLNKGGLEMDDKKIQEIYVFMDDSGQIVQNNPEQLVFVYGGVYFLSKQESDDFLRQYKSLVNSLKSKYCKDYSNTQTSLELNHCLNHDSNNCAVGDCPELKSYNLEKDDRRRLLNLIKKQRNSVVIVNNTKLHQNIFASKESIGRFKDYAIKRELKNIIMDLISSRDIDPNLPVVLHLNFDQQTTVSNGYYDLSSSIKEELQFGIQNFDYGKFFPPILKEVKIKLKYKNSYNNYNVQAADLLVGDVRHKCYYYFKDGNFELFKRNTAFIDNILFLP